MKRPRPRVITNCVADRFHVIDERIIEFSFPDGSGGLISFQSKQYPNDSNQVYIYRLDEDIEIIKQND